MTDTITLELYGDVEIQFEVDPSPDGDEIDNFWMNSVIMNNVDLLDGLDATAQDKFLENFMRAAGGESHVTELMWDAHYDR